MQRAVRVDTDKFQIDPGMGLLWPPAEVLSGREHLGHGFGVGGPAQSEVDEAWTSHLQLLHRLCHLGISQ